MGLVSRIIDICIPVVHASCKSDGAMTSEISDKDLVERFQKTKDKLYFEMLYDRHATGTYRKCVSYVKDRDLAQDVAQDVWIKVYFNLSKFKGDSKFTTWLYRITVNNCISFLRKRKTFSLDEMIEDSGTQIEDEFTDLLEEIEQKNDAKLALALVPEDVQTLLRMKYVDGYSYEEIAELTGLSQSAIKMRISRAKQLIKSEYGKQA